MREGEPSPASGLKALQALELVLTASCNLGCGYCYQNVKNPGRMCWEVLQPALGLLFDSAPKKMDVLFLGGEPLLAKALLHRAAEFIRKNRPPGKRFRLQVGTNGLLLDRATADFLVRGGFEIRLSFDGIAAAQDLRGRNTFRRLDRLLDRLREEHPFHFARRVVLCLSVSPSTVGHLPESVRYFFSKNVSRILITPVLNGDAEWRLERIAELDRAFRQVFDDSVRLWKRKRKIPVQLFRKSGLFGSGGSGQERECGFLKGLSLTVMPDGRLFGCTVLAEGYQRYPDQPLFAESVAAALRIGDLRGPGLEERYAAFLDAARRSRMFSHRAEKHSGYGTCLDCSFLTECRLCQASCRYVPGNRDPLRVSDFGCAFHRVSLQYRRLFPVRVTPLERLLLTSRAVSPRGAHTPEP